ncbi:class I SAM-dependent methyltransferase [Legionella cincinnatiensis]|uniref:Ribosomal RNA small subunit methyltransferase J n=1 Tax=Legionella cincinnatiensis TaxID=28085 RepID=A0A378IKN2_9GAMM|nr:class I SAM-dependent methyltransferase [Legionella cincinnatiensis]KTC88285.1 SAM-dependent methyltransferase [Legionella cincinnatiensis]STX35838.1 N6-adenine-specific methylase [Legionella cincinnatiensis]
MIEITTVGYEHESLYDKAHVLAKQLNFVLDKQATSCLFVTEDKLALKIPGFSPISVELSSAFWSKRKSEGKKQGLIRACKPGIGLKIIDATAGWGRDAAILASFGAEVLMIERHPVMASLLSDALLRRSESEQQKMHLSLYAGDAYSYFHILEEKDYPDVIYIDPMHPERSKSALVKKEMQVLQQIIGTDDDARDLIQLAITRTKQRVVVKWPQKSNPLLPVNAQVNGKTVRFDIYFSNSRI